MSAQTTDHSACQCFLNPLPWSSMGDFTIINQPIHTNIKSIDEQNFWEGYPKYDPVQDMVNNQLAVEYSKPLGLTDEEKLILNYLLDAWNLYVSLDQKHPDDDSEFKSGIHKLQEKIALRVARRVNPEVWRNYDNEQQ